MKYVETCYMCDAQRSSREHAPPECLFPKEKEFGHDLRRNLITVPSCDVHNSKKSEDDEFMRAVILFTAVANNNVAQHQFLGKMRRGAARSPNKYSNFITEKGTIKNGAFRALKINNRERFDSCIEHLARALFFHVYKKKWRYPVMMVSPNFYSAISNDEAVPHKPTQEIVEVSRSFLVQEPVLGDNPEVFKYRVRYDENECSYAFAGIFYDFFEVYSYSSQAAANANNA